MSKKNVTFSCKKCGGLKVQVKGWVDANTHVYAGESGDYDIDSNWCADCEEHVEFNMEEHE